MTCNFDTFSARTKTQMPTAILLSREPSKLTGLRGGAASSISRSPSDALPFLLQKAVDSYARLEEQLCRRRRLSGELLLFMVFDTFCFRSIKSIDLLSRSDFGNNASH
ncbi:hypothetical protein J6590_000515 [Homalodisca vitripennis]|nr:hypothetical protein J6590_000515 [Homalodisca vitripennis]